MMIIGTHSGTFQADEALGVWLLRQTSTYRHASVIRTRDEKILNTQCDIVLDVGGIYDHTQLKYDHHQRGYDERFAPKVIKRRKKTNNNNNNNKTSSSSTTNTETTIITTTVPRCTKLSASGLIYRHYGKEVICEYYPQLLPSNDNLNDRTASTTTTVEEELDWVYTKMYDTFMEAIDAVDTGVEPLPKGTKLKHEQHENKDDNDNISIIDDEDDVIQLLYRDNTGLSSRVSRLNPRWNEFEDNDEEKGEEEEDEEDTPTTKDGKNTKHSSTTSSTSSSTSHRGRGRGRRPDPDARFEIASEICGQEFLNILTKIVESDLPSRSIVQQAVLSRYDIDESGEIICLPYGGLPWKDTLYELEYDYDVPKLIKYVLYIDESNMWRVQCVSVEGKAFENRLSLPERWRGLRDLELSQVSGIQGCTFVHASGFIGGNGSYEGVLEMARVALAEN